MQNHFQLFHLPQRFTLDMAVLEAAYHEVQNQAHPDRFAGATGVEKRVAMQWATRANEAYRILKHPLRRARYLCELNGAQLQTESNTAMPAEFLMRQMAWHETLDEVKVRQDDVALERLQREIDGVYQDAAAQAAALLDVEDFAAAAHLVRQWLFLEKFSDHVATALERLAEDR